MTGLKAPSDRVQLMTAVRHWCPNLTTTWTNICISPATTRAVIEIRFIILLAYYNTTYWGHAVIPTIAFNCLLYIVSTIFLSPDVTRLSNIMCYVYGPFVFLTYLYQSRRNHQLTTCMVHYLTPPLYKQATDERILYKISCHWLRSKCLTIFNHPWCEPKL